MLLALLSSFSPARAQAPAWAWARNITVPPSNTLIPMRITTDASGNSYVLGQFTGTVSMGSISLVSAGSNDLFVAKLDPAGTYLWAQRLGGTGTEYVGGIAVDAAGNVLVTGTFANTMALGSTTLTASSVSAFASGFVAKYSAGGSWLWAKRFGSYFSNRTPPNIAVAPNGDVLLTGTFNATSATGALAFDFGPTALVTAGAYDIFVARLAGTDGAWRWAVRGGGTDNDEARGICTDAAGNAVVAGSFSTTAPFGSTTLTAVGGTDVLVARLDPAGQWQWAAGGGGLANEQANAVTVDRSGNPVLTGNFRSQATFGSFQVGSVQISVDDVLVAKLSSSGQWQWASRAGGSAYDYGFGVALDAQNNVYVGGTVSIDADFGSTVLNAGGLSGGVFVGRLSPTGAWQWAVAAGPPLSGYITVGFALDPAGNAFLTDRYQGTATFGPTVLNSGGQFQNGGFVAKLGNTALASRATTAALAFSVAPNPVAQGAALALHTATAGTFELRDALGRPVPAAQPVGAGTRRVVLPAALPPGVYLATLRTSVGTATQRLALE